MKACADIGAHRQKRKSDEYVAVSVRSVLAQIGVFALYLNYGIIFRFHNLLRYAVRVGKRERDI